MKKKDNQGRGSKRGRVQKNISETEDHSFEEDVKRRKNSEERSKSAESEFNESHSSTRENSPEASSREPSPLCQSRRRQEREPTRQSYPSREPNPRRQAAPRHNSKPRPQAARHNQRDPTRVRVTPRHRTPRLQVAPPFLPLYPDPHHPPNQDLQQPAIVNDDNDFQMAGDPLLQMALHLLPAPALQPLVRVNHDSDDDIEVTLETIVNRGNLDPNAPQEDNTVYCRSKAVLDSKGSELTSTIEVRMKDLEKVNGAIDWSDTLIMFRINETISRNKKILDRVAVLDSYVFTKVVDEVDMYRGYFDKAELKNIYMNCKNIKPLSNVFMKDLILIPINFEKHWMVAAVLDPWRTVEFAGAETKVKADGFSSIYLFDSLEHSDTVGASLFYNSLKIVIATIFCFLFDRAGENVINNRRSTRAEIDYYQTRRCQPTRFFLKLPQNLPIQRNLNDCGPFVAHFIDGILNEHKGLLSKFENRWKFDWVELVDQANVRVKQERELTADRIQSLAPAEHQWAVAEAMREIPSGRIGAPR